MSDSCVAHAPGRITPSLPLHTVDAWVLLTSGEIAVIRAVPHRVDRLTQAGRS
jgi:hypothetical protein